MSIRAMGAEGGKSYSLSFIDACNCSTMLDPPDSHRPQSTTLWQESWYWSRLFDGPKIFISELRNRIQLYQASKTALAATAVRVQQYPEPRLLCRAKYTTARIEEAVIVFLGIC